MNPYSVKYFELGIPVLCLIIGVALMFRLCRREERENVSCTCCTQPKTTASDVILMIACLAFMVGGVLGLLEAIGYEANPYWGQYD